MKIQNEATIYVLDDDNQSRELLLWLLSSSNYCVRSHLTLPALIRDIALDKRDYACIIADISSIASGGITLLEQLRHADIKIPVILISSTASTDQVVKAIKAGASDFFSKPYDEQSLLEAISAALLTCQQLAQYWLRQETLQQRFEGLSKREQQLLQLIMAGHSNKSISDKLHLSVKTVEYHRANLMRKTQSDSLVDLIKSYVIFQTHHDFRTTINL